MNLLISEPASSVLSLRPGSEKQSSLARKKASEGVLIVKTPKNCSRKAATRSQSRFPRPPTLTNAPDQQQHPLCSLTSLEANMGTPKAPAVPAKGMGLIQTCVSSHSTLIPKIPLQQSRRALLCLLPPQKPGGAVFRSAGSGGRSLRSQPRTEPGGKAIRGDGSSSIQQGKSLRGVVPLASAKLDAEHNLCLQS